MTSSLTTALTKNATMKDEISHLTALLDKMAINNESQIQQINLLSSENAAIKDENKQLKTEVDIIKAENVELKARLVDTSRLPHPPPVPQRRHKLKVSQWSGIT